MRGKARLTAQIGIVRGLRLNSGFKTAKGEGRRQRHVAKKKRSIVSLGEM